MEKNITIPSVHIQNNRSRNWRLLFVDDYGNMLTFQWVKTSAIVIISALVFFVFCTSVLFVLYQNNRKEKIQLKEKFDESVIHIKNLRDEMDILLAKLVLAESRMEPGHDQTRPAEKNQAMADSKTKQTVLTKETVRPNQAAVKKTTRKTVSQAIDLEVTNFKISQESGSPNTLKINFKIKNIDRSVKTASGYIFIVLKPDENDQNTWFSIPATDIRGGYPNHLKKGQFFRISRFKTVYFRARSRISLNQLKMASVFVFNKHGDRIFEKNFPILNQSGVPAKSEADNGERGSAQKTIPIVDSSLDKRRTKTMKPEETTKEKIAEPVKDKPVQKISEKGA